MGQSLISPKILKHFCVNSRFELSDRQIFIFLGPWISWIPYDSDEKKSHCPILNYHYIIPYHYPIIPYYPHDMIDMIMIWYSIIPWYDRYDFWLWNDISLSHDMIWYISLSPSLSLTGAFMEVADPIHLKNRPEPRGPGNHGVSRGITLPRCQPGTEKNGVHKGATLVKNDERLSNWQVLHAFQCFFFDSQGFHSGVPRFSWSFLRPPLGILRTLGHAGGAVWNGDHLPSKWAQFPSSHKARVHHSMGIPGF